MAQKREGGGYEPPREGLIEGLWEQYAPGGRNYMQIAAAILDLFFRLAAKSDFQLGRGVRWSIRMRIGRAVGVGQGVYRDRSC